eukprot:11575087-Alexandrium_andersonii.AAC.1
MLANPDSACRCVLLNGAELPNSCTLAGGTWEGRGGPRNGPWAHGPRKASRPSSCATAGVIRDTHCEVSNAMMRPASCLVMQMTSMACCSRNGKLRYHAVD